MAGRLGSVADRMAYFRKAMEDEKKGSKAVRQPLLTNTSNRSSTVGMKKEPTETEKLLDDGSPEQERTTQKADSQRKEPRVLKKKPELKRQMSVSSLVLTWCQDVTRGYRGVDIKNFSGSFANGLAFCALIHKFHPDKFDFDSLSPENREYNVRLAFQTGVEVGIPEILSANDFLKMKRIEPRSVQCYVQMIFSKYKPKDLDMSNLRIA